MQKKNFVVIAVLCLLVSSCVNYRQLISLESPEQTNEAVINYPNTSLLYALKTGDNIDIKFSSTDPNTSAILNKESNNNNNTQMNPVAMYLNSYVIDPEGMVDIPLIGKVKAEGLNCFELSDTISSKLHNILKLRNVSIKISNFRISILGEVKNAGQFFVYNNQINLLQALSLAGDIADYGNRQRVLIVRTNKDKSSDKVYLDLSSPETLKSKYFWLQPDDVIYVEPIRAKAGRMNLPALNISLTIISITLVIFNILQNSNK